MMHCPDAYDMWVAHDARQEKALAELPVCYYCDEPIQDGFYYEVNEEIICKDCLDSHFRKEVDW